MDATVHVGLIDHFEAVADRRVAVFNVRNVIFTTVDDDVGGICIAVKVDDVPRRRPA
jgi:myo-inositol-1-phosphate synthase